MEGGKKFDCADCVAFCCSNVYEVLLTAVEVARLSLRLNVGPAEFKRRYTTDGSTLAKKPDPIFGKACVFLDLDARHCTIYSSRPGVCKVWPRPEHAAPGAEGRCGFYDVYTHLRNELEPTAMPLFQLVRVQESEHPATRPNPARAAGAAGGE
jgi:hypothetical protein